MLRMSISAAATTLLVAAATALLGLAGMIAAGYQPQVVKSGSMSPLLERGSLVFVKPTRAAELQVGQVITFQNPIKGGKELVTHRIVAIDVKNGKRVFATRGDANDSRDPWKAEIDEQAGLLVAHVPRVGELSFLTHSRDGYIALFVIPVFLLAGLALWKIWGGAPAARDEYDPTQQPGQVQGATGFA